MWQDLATLNWARATRAGLARAGLQDKFGRISNLRGDGRSGRRWHAGLFKPEGVGISPCRSNVSRAVAIQSAVPSRVALQEMENTIRFIDFISGYRISDTFSYWMARPFTGHVA
ncbi:hypothetical protein BaRGS_00032457 [Batillaria attramentaria]|uniref:Uncharacterized protein n=1 Tax=Batillaria attramentaria TaxID=370345 RepID=A0ABD0JN37_9CAEN